MIRWTRSAVRSRSVTLVWAATLAVYLTIAIRADDYRIGPRDVLSVTVWGHPELTAKVNVASDGSLNFPLIGVVKAAGRTAPEVQAEVARRLADGFLNNPQVSVDVAEYLSQRVFVVGEVRTPGAVALTGTLTLVEALTRAGSLTENAGGELLIMRAAPGTASLAPTLPGALGSTVVLRASVERLLRGEISTNTSLVDGDTIVVPRAQSISVLGQVKTPGSVPYEFEMTVLRAISLAGGPNDVGAMGRAKIIRIVGTKKSELKANLADKLRPGDVVVVPMKLF